MDFKKGKFYRSVTYISEMEIADNLKFWENTRNWKNQKKRYEIKKIE